MRVVAICVVGLCVAWALSIETRSVNGAQFLQQTIPPGTENPPEQSPPNAPPAAGPGPNRFRRGIRPRFVPGQAPAGSPGMTRPAPGPAPGPASGRPLPSVFAIPAGLSMRTPDLYQILGYDPVTSFPLTPQTCFDVAYQCYLQEYYADAVVLARHGLTMCNDARLHLLKGVCELHLARSADAERTATDFRNALTQQQFFGMEAAHERINEPLSARFDAIVEYQNTGR
jgi:hypothetical protein